MSPISSQPKSTQTGGPLFPSNTVKVEELDNIIQYSGDEPDGVKVLSEIPGERGNNF